MGLRMDQDTIIRRLERGKRCAQDNDRDLGLSGNRFQFMDKRRCLGRLRQET